MGGTRLAECRWAIPVRLNLGTLCNPVAFYILLWRNFQMRSHEYAYKNIHYSTVCDTKIGETTAYQLGFIHAMG